jgi:putative ABC transport system substrate-binding protein
MTKLVFVVAIVLLAVTRLVTAAEQPGKVFRLGLLMNLPPTNREATSLWGAFFQELRQLGYVEGQNLRIESRVSEGKYERLPGFATELVRLEVDVIVAPSSEPVLAAKHATRTIPIVMTSNPDPVGSGLVASLARPGGNVTGLSLFLPEITGKQLEVLKEMVVGLSRVAVLWNPTNQTHRRMLDAAQIAADSMRVRLQPLEARGPDDFERAFAAMTRERAGALVVLRDGMFLLHRKQIADLAAKSRLPVMYGGKDEVDSGGLMAYGPSIRNSFRRAAVYVDKILKGAKPADLPVEQPTTFELIINTKTAKALGLTIPPALLLRADALIE